MKLFCVRWNEADRRKKILAFFIGTIFLTLLARILWQHFHGVSFGWIEHDDWMDFFNVNYWSQKGFNPYTSEFRSSYPPLILFFAKLVSYLADYSRDTFIVAKTFWGIVSYHLVFLGFSALTVLAFVRMMKDRGCSVGQRIGVSVALMLTVPYLYAYERGNYIFLVVTCIAWFFAWFQSEKRWQRETALVLLAVAAGIKLYPAFLAAILLRDRRFKDFFKTCLYTVAAFFLPFLAFSGGFSNVGAFIENLTSFQALNPASALNYSMPTFLFYFSQLGNGLVLSEAPNWVFSVGGVLASALLVLGLLLSLFADRAWKSFALISVALIVYPAPSFLYSASLLLPVVVLFLTEENPRRIHWVYTSLFLLILAPISLGYLVSPYIFPGGLLRDNLMQQSAMLCLFLLLSVESIANLWRTLRRGRKSFSENS